jgi:hypothetical protein
MKLIGVLAIALATSSSYLLGDPVSSASADATAGKSLPAKTFESGETQTTLIELFTSEGCSSCPPAEKWLSELKSNPDLWKRTVPVAFHVDYWDRLGWRDRFAKPEFTSRQQRYASAWRIDSVYTPNFVVNGREWKGWLNNGMLSARSENVGKLRVVLNGNSEITATFSGTQAGPLELEVAMLGANLESDVKRGENSGRKLRHDFVVLSLAKINMTRTGADWTGTTVLPKAGAFDRPTALAVWVMQNTVPIQATGGWLVEAVENKSRVNGMSETEGKAAMVAATERGKRGRFNDSKN